MTNDVELAAQAVAASVIPVSPLPFSALAATNPGDVTKGLIDVTVARPISDDDFIRTATRGRRRLGLLGEHDFCQLFIADSGSQFGTQVGMLALPLVAAVTLHATAFEMGVVSAANTLPLLLASLPAGPLVDRVRELTPVGHDHPNARSGQLPGSCPAVPPPTGRLSGSRGDHGRQPGDSGKLR